jgi:hypothetical protein
MHLLLSVPSTVKLHETISWVEIATWPAQRRCSLCLLDEVLVMHYPIFEWKLFSVHLFKTLINVQVCIKRREATRKTKQRKGSRRKNGVIRNEFTEYATPSKEHSTPTCYEVDFSITIRHGWNVLDLADCPETRIALAQYCRQIRLVFVWHWPQRAEIRGVAT